ncbi:MAG: phage tail tube protein [Planctomycetaceae bacterium]|nr:phage tail tube protein [Planctomycetaceae bacterium]
MPHGSIYWSQVVGVGPTGGAVTKQLQNVNCGIGKTGTIINKDGARGTRSKHAGNANTGPHTVGGPLSVLPTPDEWDTLLPYVLGGTRTGGGTAGSPWVYPLAEVLPSARFSQDLRLNGTGADAMVFHWDGCKINTARISASAGGQLVTLDLDAQGKTQTVNNSWPAIAATLTTDKPFIMGQLALSLAAVNRQIDDFSINIDNALILDRFLNSLTRTEIPEADRTISVECANPFTIADIALYEIAVAGIAGVATFTNGLSVLTFTFANLKAPPETIERAQRGEAMNRLRFTAYETGTPGTTTKELVTTLSTS